MFEKVFGLPAHPLVVHAAVVLIPIAVLAAFAYVLVPRLRSKVGWVLVLSALSGAGAAIVAAETGDRFAQYLGGSPTINEHGGFGLDTRNMAVLLAVVAVVLVVVERARGTRRAQAPVYDQRDQWTNVGEPQRDSSGSTVLKVVSIVLSVALLGTAVGAAVSVVRAGDTGARMVWEGR
ncbi:DUF2231 domain-containing protein [Cryptosporangium aurantiacum]|uniref:DUF2231 domain-containing protein n=1 Tax=Cryptosporangium aurantiacum TaxID=134849 RepID=A0A1M7QPS2_9ACTN|nr:DUF2231 domain-containing protein [Cryptosporangium aurantiacum]SHN33221.1 hypothetical protein SAMN05443668_105126 [Cryptosporangium aurantiacum]